MRARGTGTKGEEGGEAGRRKGYRSLVAEEGQAGVEMQRNRNQQVEGEVGEERRRGAGVEGSTLVGVEAGLPERAALPERPERSSWQRKKRKY